MKPVSSKLLYGHICQLVMDISPTISCTITLYHDPRKLAFQYSVKPFMQHPDCVKRELPRIVDQLVISYIKFFAISLRCERLGITLR